MRVSVACLLTVSLLVASLLAAWLLASCLCMKWEEGLPVRGKGGLYSRPAACADDVWLLHDYMFN